MRAGALTFLERSNVGSAKFEWTGGREAGDGGHGLSMREAGSLCMQGNSVAIRLVVVSGLAAVSSDNFSAAGYAFLCTGLHKETTAMIAGSTVVNENVMPAEVGIAKGRKRERLFERSSGAAGNGMVSIEL